LISMKTQGATDAARLFASVSGWVRVSRSSRTAALSD
jgi:hypothetical protein